MKLLHLRTRRVLLITLIGFGVLLLLTGSVLTWYVRKQLILQLQQTNVHFTSVHFNPLTRSIAIMNLAWEAQTDSLVGGPDAGIVMPHSANLRYIKLSGISIFQFVNRKKIKIRKITLEDGGMVLNQEFRFSGRNDSLSTALSGIEIDRLIIRNVNVRISRDTVCEYSGNINLSLGTIGLEDSRNISSLSAYTVKSIEAELKELSIRKKGSPYTLQFDRVYFNEQQQKLTIDCLFLQPNYGKYEFSKAIGRQVTRLDVKIPQIEATGLTYGVQMSDSSIMVAKIVIQNADVYALRDKRFPFRQKENIPLPMELFRTMSMAIEIDTIQVMNSEILYEHFQEEAFRPGKFAFSNINAVFCNVNNREYYNRSKHATLKANAHLMGEGMIYTTLLLPLGENHDYHASGKIVKLPLNDLNPMLEHTAFLKIQSGTLEEMKFDFDFNDDGSEGQVELNYTELRLLSLHKDKQARVNQFKTILVNTALQNNQIRGGDINMRRDKKRYIFHLLAHSILDGTRSAVTGKPNKSQLNSKATP